MSRQSSQNAVNHPHGERRIVLSAPGLSCEAEFLEAVRCSEGLHRPWVSPPRSHEEFQSYLDKIASGRTIGFFVLQNSDRRLAGVINVSEPVMGLFRSAYLGFYAFAGFERQGYMTEALSLVLDGAFGELGFHRLEANIQPGNVASAALVGRLGFRKEGFSPGYLLIDGAWRDHDRWATLSDEWAKNRPRVFAS